MPPPYTSFVLGTPAVSAFKAEITDLGIVLKGPSQGTQPSPVPATGQLFPTGNAPQQGA